GNGGLIESARVKDPCLQGRGQLQAHIRSGWRSLQWDGASSRAGDALQEHLWSSCGDVQINVVIRRIIEQSITAGNDRFAAARQMPASLRRPGKTNAGTKAVLDTSDPRIGAHTQRQRRIPECRRGI